MNAVQRLAHLRRALAGRFRIDGHLGSGGYADVYRVTNLHLDRPEALKVLTGDHPDDPVFVERFLHESRLSASLVHPSIVRVYDSGEVEGTLWYSMELVEGRTLAAEADTLGPLPEGRIAEVAVPLLDALAYSHEHGVVHRDVKPENVLVDAAGVPHLMDFGIAKSPRSLMKTQTGFVIGTPAFVAPEQARGLPIDGRADLYALAVSLYNLASGRFPFEAGDPLQAVVLRLTDPPTPLCRHRPGVDPAFEAILMKGLERDPDSRWLTAREMKEAFEAFLRGEAPLLPAQPPAPSPAPSPASPEPQGGATEVLPVSPLEMAAGRTAPPPARRTPLVAATGVLVAVAAAAGWMLARREPAPAPAPIPSAATPATAAAPASLPTAPPPAAAAPTAAPLRLPRATAAPEPAPPARPVQPPQRLPSEDRLPEGLTEACAGVSVAVTFAVDAEGAVSRPSVISRDHPECARFALEVLKGWRFEPARDASGAPVPSARQAASVQLGPPRS